MLLSPLDKCFPTFIANFTGSMSWATLSPLSCPFKERFAARWKRLPAIQPTGAKVNIPCADFFYLKNGKIDRFDCYPALKIMFTQMGAPPDFASAVKRSTKASK